jgi:hypothetical protein
MRILRLPEVFRELWRQRLPFLFFSWAISTTGLIASLYAEKIASNRIYVAMALVVLFACHLAIEARYVSAYGRNIIRSVLRFKDKPILVVGTFSSSVAGRSMLQFNERDQDAGKLFAKAFDPTPDLKRAPEISNETVFGQDVILIAGPFPNPHTRNFIDKIKARKLNVFYIADGDVMTNTSMPSLRLACDYESSTTVDYGTIYVGPNPFDLDNDHRMVVCYGIGEWATYFAADRFLRRETLETASQLLGSSNEKYISILFKYEGPKSNRVSGHTEVVAVSTGRVG